MIILNRDIYRYIKHIHEIPLYIYYLCKCIMLFKNPISFIYAYLSVSQPPNRMVALRSGMKLYLSNHPHDIITIFIIFVRKDYGNIQHDSVVVDIGANIGIFAMYAAYCGAARVVAYEPNLEAYKHLLENIRSNHLQDRILPHRFAVTKDLRSGDVVKFPTKASLYNAIITDDRIKDFEVVGTVSVKTIVNEVGYVDLLKLDCEGAEYDILLTTNSDVFGKIGAIRLEYHDGQSRKNLLSLFMKQNHFTEIYHKRESSVSGNVWYKRM